jgi:hypothetical protein
MEELLNRIRGALYLANAGGWKPTVIRLNQSFDALVAHLKATDQPLQVEGVPIGQSMRAGVVDDAGRFVNFDE